jgi:sugar phosphate isomerase/epimerase
VEGIITHAALTDSLFKSEKAPLDLKGSVVLAVALGGDLVTFHMGGYPDGLPHDDAWKRTVSYIREAADYAAARHIGLAVDGIWFDWIVDSPDALARLFGDVASPNFGVNFDPCYLTLMGIDPARFARRFQKNLLHAHLKDHRLESHAEAGSGRPPKWTHLLPGRGEMDYASIFKTLDALKFDRSCAVECFTDMKFEEACDDCFTDLTAAAARGGVRFQR